MFSAIWNTCKSFFNRVKETIKKQTKPEMTSLGPYIPFCPYPSTNLL